MFYVFIIFILFYNHNLLSLQNEISVLERTTLAFLTTIFTALFSYSKHFLILNSYKNSEENYSV